jgi:hypothetical protein
MREVRICQQDVGIGDEKIQGFDDRGVGFGFVRGARRHGGFHSGTHIDC